MTESVPLHRERQRERLSGAPRPAPLAMDAQAFRRAGHRLVDTVADFLSTLPSRPLMRGAAPETIRAALDAQAALPDEGMDPEELLRW